MLQRWQLKTTFPTTLSFVLYADGDVPVSFEQNLTYAGGAYSVEYRFLTFAASAEIPHVWDDFNRSAFSYTPPCPTAASGAPPPPRTQSLYIFHPRHDFNISQQDIADAVGDVFFLCQNLGQSEKALERPAGEDYEWISEWRVELIPRWGSIKTVTATLRRGALATKTLGGARGRHRARSATLRPMRGQSSSRRVVQPAGGRPLPAKRGP